MFDHHPIVLHRISKVFRLLGEAEESATTSRNQ